MRSRRHERDNVKANFADTVIANLKGGDAASVLPNDPPGERMAGRVSRIARSSDAANRTIEVWVNLGNAAGRLRAGSAAEVSVATESTDDALVVPASAVTLEATNGDTGTVMVVDADQIAHETKVTTGIRTPELIQITAGLQAGATVVVENIVLLPNSSRQSLDTLRGLMIRSVATGAQFRLDQVADVAYEQGQTEIERDGLRQSVAVTARLSGSDLGSAISEIKTKLASDVRLPPGMTIEYGGLYQEQQASFRELALALLSAIALVFVVLLIEFRSFAHPIAIVSGAILALGGVLAALFITKSTLNVVSLMGMIMTVGIVAKNGILMLDAVDEHLAAGDSLRAALMRSGRRRFRPVLMTTLAAILGMLPLALAIGAGAELLQPLAIAVIGGLTVALALSLIVTPTVYMALKMTARGSYQATKPG